MLPLLCKMLESVGHLDIEAVGGEVNAKLANLFLFN